MDVMDVMLVVGTCWFLRWLLVHVGFYVGSWYMLVSMDVMNLNFE
jgi:hypothetical protein